MQRPRGLDGDETVEFDGTAGGISSLCGAGGKRRGIQFARRDIRVAVRRAVRRGFGLRGFARRVDGVGLHTDCGAFNQHSARVRPFHHSGKQYCTDHWLCGRVCRRGRDFFHAGLNLPGIFTQRRILAHIFPRADGRVARRAVHDPAAAAIDRERAWEFDFPGGHGLRRRAGGGRARRIVCRARLLGIGAGRPLHICDEHAAHVAVAAGLSAEMAAGRFVPRQHHFGISGSRIHHRAARFRDAIRGRRDFLAGDHAGDQIFRIAFGECSAVSLHDSDRADDAPINFTAATFVRLAQGRWLLRG